MTSVLPPRVRAEPPLPVRLLTARGIFYGWAVVFASFVVTFCEMPTFNPVLTLFLIPMTSEFGWTRSEFSGVVVLSTIGSALVVPVIGTLIDRYGPRVALVVGATVLGIEIGALAFTSSIAWFYFWYTVARIAANGGTGIANTVVISNWFTRRRAFAFGIIASAWRLGSWVLPLVLAVTIAAYGWRAAWALLGIGILALAVPIPALLTIRRPQDVGLEPEGQPRSGHCHGGPAWSLREAVRTRALWLVAVGGFCAWFTMASYNLHLMPYLLDRGFPAEIAVGALAGMGFISMPATVLIGLLADRIGVRPTYLLAFVLATLGATFILWLAAPWMIAAYAVCYGIAFGSFVTLQQSIWADYFGRGSLGAIRGVTLPVQLMGNAFGPFLAAVAYDLTGSYDLPFTAFILALLLGAVTIGLARRPRRPLLQPLAVSQEVA